MRAIQASIAIAVLGASILPAADSDGPWIPAEVSACLARAGADESRLLVTQNPFYLRGDFDGDGRNDYAVAIKGTKPADTGFLVCTAGGHIASLGRAGAAKASMIAGFEEPVFPANWQVLSRPVALAERKEDPKLPPVLTGLRGEAISLIWRDELAIVYWNGARFRFSGVYQ